MFNQANNIKKDKKKNKKENNLVEVLKNILIDKKDKFSFKVLDMQYFVTINAKLNSKKFIKRTFIFGICLN